MAKSIVALQKEKFDRLPLRKFYIIGFLISLVTLLGGILSQIILPPLVPLYYGLPESEKQLAPSILIILPSLVSILIIVFNAYISIFAESIYLKRALVFSSLAISVLAGITTFRIILLVGNI